MENLEFDFKVSSLVPYRLCNTKPKIPRPTSYTTFFLGVGNGGQGVGREGATDHFSMSLQCDTYICDTSCERCKGYFMGLEIRYLALTEVTRNLSSAAAGSGGADLQAGCLEAGLGKHRMVRNKKGEVCFQFNTKEFSFYPEAMDRK